MCLKKKAGNIWMPLKFLGKNQFSPKLSPVSSKVDVFKSFKSICLKFEAFGLTAHYLQSVVETMSLHKKVAKN